MYLYWDEKLKLSKFARPQERLGVEPQKHFPGSTMHTRTFCFGHFTKDHQSIDHSGGLLRLQATCRRNARHLPEPACASISIDCSAKYHPSQIHQQLLAKRTSYPYRSLTRIVRRRRRDTRGQASSLVTSISVAEACLLSSHFQAPVTIIPPLARRLACCTSHHDT